MKNGFFALSAALVSGLAVAVGVGLFQPNSSNSPSNLYAQQTVQAEQVDFGSAIAGAENLSKAFKGAAKLLRPSVVKVTAMVDGRSRLRGGYDGFGIPEEFRGLLPEEFFRGGRSPRQLPREEESSPKKLQAGVGSGVIITPNGYVLTNNHVVDDADELEVLLSDGRKFAAKVVGKDAKSDVAVLKIEASGLMPARLGDSSKMEVGDWVIAIGSPFELDQTVTAGIISATHRSGIGILENQETRGYEDFLQTDAAINPGNSGGPLVNLRGEVIGINTAINSSSGSNAGVGFAIPSNMANDVMQSILKNGKVVRSYIGAVLKELTPELMSEQKLPSSQLAGAVIDVVRKDTPAAKAGIRAGDVVVSIDEQAVKSVSDLRNRISMKVPGKPIQLRLFRDGREQTVAVIPEEYTDEQLALLGGELKIEKLGIAVATLTPEIAKEAGYESELTGALITAIDRRNRIAQNLQAGDVITKINGTEIKEAVDVAAAVERSPRGVRIILRRGDDEKMLTTN